MWPFTVRIFSYGHKSSAHIKKLPQTTYREQSIYIDNSPFRFGHLATNKAPMQHKGKQLTKCYSTSVVVSAHSK